MKASCTCFGWMHYCDKGGTYTHVDTALRGCLACANCTCSSDRANNDNLDQHCVAVTNQEACSLPTCKCQTHALVDAYIGVINMHACSDVLQPVNVW